MHAHLAPGALRAAFPALLLWLLACGTGNPLTPYASDAGLPTHAEGAPLTPNVRALIEIHALDLWAQPLPSSARLLVRRDGVTVPTAGWPIATFPVEEAGTYDITLSADGHERLQFAILYDGSTTLDATALRRYAGGELAGLVTSHDVRTVSGRTLPVHAFFTGLRHRWFSAHGRPARRGNRIRLLTNGEEAWGRVAEDLLSAVDRVHVATWWWTSDFELVRDADTHVQSRREEREANTILGMLDDIFPTKRVLVGHLLGQDGRLSWLTTDGDLRSRGAAPDDDFEFMGQANPTRGRFAWEIEPFSFGERVLDRWEESRARSLTHDEPIASTVPGYVVDLTRWPIRASIQHASYHQKFMVLDGRVAFVGGMNFRHVDWDTDEHLVFDPRRMKIGASASARAAVASGRRMPDSGPRKDYMARVEGPLVEDVEDLFRERWTSQLDADVQYAENASDYEVTSGLPAFVDGVQAQVTATMPAPFHEHSIAETWLNAIQNAEHFIFIEDQFFRMPLLLDALIERMTEVPSLDLVVITKPVGEYTDPGCWWTHQMSEALRTRFPSRYHTFQLRSFDTQVSWGARRARFAKVDVHSKLMIVDDVFLSVGSCNKNNRGLVFEGELNIAVYDPAWVAAERRRVLSLVLPEGVEPADVPRAWVEQLHRAADWNQRVRDEWDTVRGAISSEDVPLPTRFQAEGLIYPLQFDSPSECLIRNVGADMT